MVDLFIMTTVIVIIMTVVVTVVTVVTDYLDDRDRRAVERHAELRRLQLAQERRRMEIKARALRADLIALSRRAR